MDYIIKDLVFTKKTSTTCVSKVKIHDILEIEVKIVEHAMDASYHVDFYSYTGYECFKTSDDNCSCYYKYGFKTYKEAKDYANKEIKSILNNFISSVLTDIDDYIEEIDNNEL